MTQGCSHAHIIAACDPPNPNSNLFKPSLEVSTPMEQSSSKLPPVDTICSSCKRKRISEPDQLDASDAAVHNVKKRKPRLETNSLAYLEIVVAKDCKESEKDQPPRESGEDELRGFYIFKSFQSWFV